MTSQIPPFVNMIKLAQISYIKCINKYDIKSQILLIYDTIKHFWSDYKFDEEGVNFLLMFSQEEHTTISAILIYLRLIYICNVYNSAESKIYRKYLNYISNNSFCSFLESHKHDFLEDITSEHEIMFGTKIKKTLEQYNANNLAIAESIQLD